MPRKDKVMHWQFWIRDELTGGEKFAHELWSGYKDHVEQQGYHAPSYSSFLKYLYYLVALGLVEKTGTEPKSGVGFDKQYYAIVPERTGSIDWSDPVEAWRREHGTI